MKAESSAMRKNTRGLRAGRGRSEEERKKGSVVRMRGLFGFGAKLGESEVRTFLKRSMIAGGGGWLLEEVGLGMYMFAFAEIRINLFRVIARYRQCFPFV